jgi:hypothetical protein
VPFRPHRTIRGVALIALTIYARPECRSALARDEIHVMQEGADDEVDDAPDSRSAYFDRPDL